MVRWESRERRDWDKNDLIKQQPEFFLIRSSMSHKQKNCRQARHRLRKATDREKIPKAAGGKENTAMERGEGWLCGRGLAQGRPDIWGSAELTQRRVL